MKICPYCGQPLDGKLDRCNKCGIILSPKRESGSIRCSKCGGILKGIETRCPWCGFPCAPTHVGGDSEAYQILKTLENTLRHFIHQTLSNVDGKWWETRIPEDVRTEANRRKRKDEKLYPWHVQKIYHPYTTLISPVMPKLLPLIKTGIIFSRKLSKISISL